MDVYWTNDFNKHNSTKGNLWQVVKQASYVHICITMNTWVRCHGIQCHGPQWAWTSLQQPWIMWTKVSALGWVLIFQMECVCVCIVYFSHVCKTINYLAHNLLESWSRIVRIFQYPTMVIGYPQISLVMERKCVIVLLQKRDPIYS